MGELRSMVVSPQWPPQLNSTICGCRCGCGCGCAGDGGSSDSERLSDSETAIDLSESENSDSLVPTQNIASEGVNGGDTAHTHAGLFAPRAIPYQFIVWLRETTENLRLNNILLGQEQVTTRHLPYNFNEGAAEDPLNNTGGAESPVPGQGVVQVMTPGPGIGAWVPVGPDVSFSEHHHGSYVLNPLRLSAE